MKQQIQHREEKQKISTVCMTERGCKIFDWCNHQLVTALDLENARNESIQSYANDNDEVQKNVLKDIFIAIACYFKSAHDMPNAEAGINNSVANCDFLDKKYIEYIHMIFKRKNFRAKNVRAVLCEDLFVLVSYEPFMFDIIFAKMKSCLFREEIYDAIKTMLDTPMITYRKESKNMITLLSFIKSDLNQEQQKKLLFGKNLRKFIVNYHPIFMNLKDFFLIFEDILTPQEKQYCVTFLCLRWFFHISDSYKNIESPFYNIDLDSIEYIAPKDFTSEHIVFGDFMKNDWDMRSYNFDKILLYLTPEHIYFLPETRMDNYIDIAIISSDIKKEQLRYILPYLYIYSDKYKTILNQSAAYSMLQNKTNVAKLLFNSKVKRYDEIAKEVVDQLI